MVRLIRVPFPVYRSDEHDPVDPAPFVVSQVSLSRKDLYMAGRPNTLKLLIQGPDRPA
jgi:hypothetical protein